MAVQMHVAHSAIMHGVGVIAGVTYDCANSSLMTAAQRLAQGLLCPPGNVDYAPASIARTAAAAVVPGAIDDPAANLPRQKIWLFSGYNDGSVRRGAMNAVDAYYRNYAASGNVFYQTDNRAPHALVTDNYGGPCLGVNAKYINNCGYDAAGHLLQHIYGRLNPPDSSAATGSVLAFDQGEFVRRRKSECDRTRGHGLCLHSEFMSVGHAMSRACRVSRLQAVCGEGRATRSIVTRVITDGQAPTGSSCSIRKPPLRWKIQKDVSIGGVSVSRSAQAISRARPGQQISAFKKMLDRLAQGFVAAPGSPAAFGTPEDLSIADSTSMSLAMIWTAQYRRRGVQRLSLNCERGTVCKNKQHSRGGR